MTKPTTKYQAAYARAYSALITAWGQGVRNESLSGESLLFAECSDKQPFINSFRIKHLRGINRLPFLAQPNEFEINQS